MPLTKEEQKAWAFVKGKGTPVNSKEYGVHLKKDSKAASKIFGSLIKKGKLESFQQTDADGITRYYYFVPDTKAVETKEPKPVAEPKPSPLKDVYDENYYEHNMKLLAKSFFNYIEKDLKLKVAVAPAPKEKEKENKDPDAPKLSKEEKRELEQRKKIERDSVARREHLRAMLNTWFPAWAHIQSLRFTNPTGRARTHAELQHALQTGVL
jgi:hypothetical protein